ncbi:MAG TPA: response regulator transcription factor, partial [Mariprofundaceae bacterium]|nr:response regulator transcription factor [Mariprofundaceae bacterium]
MLQVQLIDDHEVVRKGIRRLLEDSGEIQVICESDNGESGFQDYCRHKPDVLLLDLAMPGGDGMALLKQLLAKQPDIKVLVLSMYDDVVFPRRALALGASGYVSKGASADVLLEAVFQVARGGRYVEP